MDLPFCKKDIDACMLDALHNGHTKGKRVSEAARELRRRFKPGLTITDLKTVIRSMKGMKVKGKRAGGFLMSRGINQDGSFYNGPMNGVSSVGFGRQRGGNMLNYPVSNAGKGTSKYFVTSYNPFPTDLGGGDLGYLRTGKPIGGTDWSRSMRRRWRAVKKPVNYRTQQLKQYAMQLKRYLMTGRGGRDAQGNRSVVEMVPGLNMEGINDNPHIRANQYY